MKCSEKSERSTGMKYKVIYLPIANRDIVKIDDALTEYPNKAKRIFKEMESKV